MIGQQYLNWLGMRANGHEMIAKPGVRALYELSAQLRKFINCIPNKNLCFTVFSGFLDSYLRNIIAPDHLLACIWRCLTDILFAHLSKGSDCILLHSELCFIVRDVGLGTNMTNLYSVISISPLTSKTLNCSTFIPIFSLVCLFSDLMVLSF